MLGSDILAKAKPHNGEEYILGANVPLDNPNWTGPWDCAEYVSWLVYQSYGIVFGCGTQDVDTAEPYTGHWASEAQSRGILIPVDDAARTPGAFLIRKPRFNPSRIGHIGIAIGDGTVYEAAGAALGVRIGPIAGRRSSAPRWRPSSSAPTGTCPTALPKGRRRPRPLAIRGSCRAITSRSCAAARTG